MDIELVIKLPEEIYKASQIIDVKYEDIIQIPLEVIANGTPLSKGHGDIVDIETLIDMFWDGNSMEITNYELSVIEPIIEADTAESEDKTE